MAPDLPDAPPRPADLTADEAIALKMAEQLRDRIARERGTVELLSSYLKGSGTAPD